MLELWLARHGETEWSLGGRHTGSTDLPLLPVGEEKAYRLGERLKGEHFAAVYASPMQRAQKTAALAGFADFEVTPLLKEYDYGQYEGVTSRDIRSTRPGWELFSDGCPGGESPQQVYERARRFIEMAVRKTHEGRILAFAHGHILRTVGTAWIGEPVSMAARLSLDTAGLCVLRDGDHGRVLQLWNYAGKP